MAARIAAPRRIATLGMFIIDEFQFINPETGEDEGDHGLGHHVGGGGTYFTVGARVWVPPSELSMLIDRGADFPSSIADTLEAFNRTGVSSTATPCSMWRFRQRTDGHGTTRALNIYKGEQRGFKYLTPKIRLDPRHQLYEVPSPRIPSAPDGPRPVSATMLPSYLHFICSPERATLICDEVDELLRTGKARNARRPALVWEPIPDSAVPENCEECVRVMTRIDVFSPNHEEAASLLNVDIKDEDKDQASVAADSHHQRARARDLISQLVAERFLDLSAPSQDSQAEETLARTRCYGSNGPIVHIRSGALGSLIGHRSVGCRWVDAYHTADEAKAGVIKDVTGAGNACLGGLTAALSEHEDELVALLSKERDHLSEADKARALDLLSRCAAAGSVSASFVIEQQGLPSFEAVDAEERWNGDTAASRLRRLLPES